MVKKTAKFFGIGRTFAKGVGGIPGRVEDKDLIRDSVFQILNTGRGSRVMRPGFGSQLHSLVFESQGPILSALIKREVVGVLARTEPRIQVLEVKVTQENETKAVVDVLYRCLGVEDTIQIPVGE